jgi:hypothetical protein
MYIRHFFFYFLDIFFLFILKDTAPHIPFRESFKALLCFGIYLANGGGISQKVSQSLALKDGVIELYNQNASTHEVYANITGVWASDRTSANGKYLIIGNEGNEFVVSDGSFNGVMMAILVLS